MAGWRSRLVILAHLLGCWRFVEDITAAWTERADALDRDRQFDRALIPGAGAVILFTRNRRRGALSTH
ncbi:hypothetical protein ACFQL7_24550 [Halocatena marina]|uniref:Uncharacterized protein n=1 Tax=Halocatena marina TaxID=2934937 RepID=A0ABD5YTX9_9EURY